MNGLKTYIFAVLTVAFTIYRYYHGLIDENTAIVIISPAVLACFVRHGIHTTNVRNNRNHSRS